jgi:hypothetical protein
MTSDLQNTRALRKPHGRFNQSGFVYFVAPDALYVRSDGDEGKRVKIGFSSGIPSVRLRSLQTGSPLLIKVWLYFPAIEWAERCLHIALSEYQSHGEWFHATSPIVALMSKLAPETLDGTRVCPVKFRDVLRDSEFGSSPDLAYFFSKHYDRFLEAQ